MGSAEAASFDCAKAAAPIEKLICSDADLSALDGRMGDLYSTKRHADGADRDALAAEQRRWLKLRNQACGVPDKGNVADTDLPGMMSCLTTVYGERITALGGLPTRKESSAIETALAQIAPSAEALRVDVMTAEENWDGELDRLMQRERDRRLSSSAMERLTRLMIAGGDTRPFLWLEMAESIEERGNEDRMGDALAAYAIAHDLMVDDTYSRAGLIRTSIKSGQVELARGLLHLLVPNPTPARIQATLISVLADHGLRVDEIDARIVDGRGRVCANMTNAMPSAVQQDYTPFFRISPAADIVPIVDGRQVCLSGVRPGVTYQAEMRQGVLAANGLSMIKPVSAEVTVPNLDPSIGFPGDGYVLPKVGAKGLPLTTINTESVDLKLLRIDDRNIIHQKYRRNLLERVPYWRMEDLEENEASLVWEGSVDTPGPANEPVITALPLDELIGTPEPGFYLMVAREPGAGNYDEAAVQWMVVSDLGLISYVGEDGLTIAARSLAKAAPLSGVTVTLYARNNHALTNVVTGADGIARFDAGWLRGKAGDRVDSLMALSADGDFAYLDLTGPALDLTDRGVGGRTQTGSVDGFLYTDRGIYRPGETIHLSGLARTADAKANPDLPISLSIYRPDGKLVETREAIGDAAGVISTDIHTSRTDRTGEWRVTAAMTRDGTPFAEVTYRVDDFVPPRIEVTLNTTAQIATPNTPLEASIQADFLYGAPASGLSGEAQLIVEADPAPFKGYEAFTFGKPGDAVTPIRVPATIDPTGPDGSATFSVLLPNAPITSLPLRIRLRGSVFEEGGRPVSQLTTLPLRTGKPAVGIKPGFTGGRVSYRAPAPFDLVLLDDQGAPVGGTLEWRLVEEERNYFWYKDGRDWRWRYTTRDRDVDAGTLVATRDEPVRLTTKPDGWGRYRLEITDPASGSVSGVQFNAGWSSSPIAGTAPDRMLVKLDRPSYEPGETAKIRLEAPFAGEVVIAVLGNKVHHLQQVSVPVEGATVPLTISADWGIGAYITATALRPAGIDAERGPSRAMGLSWLSIREPNRALTVSLEVPEKIRPRSTLSVPVRVAGLKAGPARVTLAAVDEGVLQFTGFKTPDPVSHFFGKRRLGVDIRDLYGRLIDARKGRLGELRSGGDASALTAGPDKRSSRVVALFSGIVALDENGQAEIALDVPDFNGRLRLMAVAAGPEGIGSGEARVTVADPVVATLSLPRFVAPRDRAEIGISLAVTDGPQGTYAYELTTDGPFQVADASGSLSLAPGQRERRVVDLTATAAGNGVLTLSVDGPGDADVVRTYDLTSRPASVRIIERDLMSLVSGGEMAISADRLDGLDPGTLTVSASTAMNIDMKGLVNELSVYPYGCLEQTTSRALPLLYAAGLSDEDILGIDPATLKQRVEAAARRIVGMQRRDGSFGMWSSSGNREPWLSVYALDFLSRAHEAGFDVNRTSLDRGLSWMSDYLLNTSPREGELQARTLSIPYAGYVLARNGRVDAANLGWLFDRFRDVGAMTPMMGAQFAAAFHHLGDQQRARQALSDEETGLSLVSLQDIGYATFGSGLRDLAARFAFIAEAGDPLGEMDGLADQISEGWANERYLSTQTASWLVLAAQAAQTGRQPDVAVDGVPLKATNGTAAISFAAIDLAAPARLTNRAEQQVRIALTRAGHPDRPLPSAENGFGIERKFFTPDGQEADLTKVRQNDLLVAVIKGVSATGLQSPSRALIADLLPAGFELEDTALNRGASVNDLNWIGERQKTQFEELRDDRYVASFEIDPGDRFTLAYMVRAVTTGRFAVANIHVEDMYEPRLNARSGAGTVLIAPAE